MTNTPIINFVIAGICLYAFIHHFIIGLRRPLDLVNIFFSLMVLSRALYIGNVAIVDTSTTVDLFLQHERIGVYFLVFFWISFVLFSNYFTKIILPRFSIFLIFCSLIILVYNMLSEYSIIYSDVSGLTYDESPFGDITPSLDSTMNPFLLFSYIMSLTCIGMALYQNYKSTELKPKMKMVFTCALSFFLLAVINDLMIEFGLYSFIFIGTYGFLSFLFLMSSNLNFSLQELELQIQQKTNHLQTMKRDRESLQEQLFHSQKMEAIGTLAGGIAHDFNNLLLSIIGYSDMIMNQSDRKSEIFEYAKTIHSSGTKATSLTKQLLTFSRKQYANVVPVDLAEKVNESITLLHPILKENIHINTKIDSGSGRILADPGQIDQVLMNLTVNAQDALPQGGQIEISVKSIILSESFCKQNIDFQPGTYALLKVCDNGIGINKDIQSKIFDPFFTSKEIGKGTGLGLSTVYGIVQKYKGHILFNSELNQGTCFSLYFPITEIQLQEDSQVQPIKRSNLSGLRILIVEDHLEILTYLQRSLQQQGFKITTATSAETALEIYNTYHHPFDILITDIILPHKSGKELADIIREQNPQLFVIFMSGYTDEIVEKLDVSPSNTKYLEKPFIVKELLDTIDSLIKIDERNSQ